MPTSPRPVGLTLVLAGGSSLGAYHAGVLSALLTARNALGPSGSLRIDAIGGASAGALVAMLGGWAVATGRDPVWLLREAWVERVDIDVLRARNSRSPLAAEGLRRGLVELLGEAPAAADTDPADVVVDVSLTGLRGLTYPVNGLRGPDSVRASTYADWFTKRLDRQARLEDVIAPEGSSLLDAALASAANPAGFPPRQLDRSDERDAYERRGVDHLPDPATLWYADGGLVQARPVRRAVEAATPQGDAQRIVVLVDPRSEDPDAAGEWADADHDAGWTDAVKRGMAIQSAHEMYEDLRLLVDENARLRSAERLAELLATHLDTSTTDDLRDGLLAEGFDESPTGDDTLEALLRQALAALTGVSGRAHVDADVISPLLLTDGGDGTPPKVLAGEILGDFGGFLDRRLRASDFDLGYACGTLWLRDGLAASDLTDAEVDTAVAAAQAAHTTDWRRTNRGDVDPDDLDGAARSAAGRLALHLLRVTAAHAVPTTQLSARRVREVPGQMVARFRRRAGRMSPW